MKYIISILIAIFSLIYGQFEKNYDFYEGPFIFYQRDSLTIKYIQDSTVYAYELFMHDTTTFPGFLKDSIETYSIPSQFNQVDDYYPVSDKILVISDPHGQYEIFKQLLVNNKVIDNDCNWIFDNNQLVVLGDVFDRGDTVHDILWLIYKLEGEAENCGGKVHFLLGNHEIMVLQNDLVLRAAKGEKLEIPNIYGLDTFWGRWIRSKNVLICIGPYLLVHGGIHPDIINKYDTISRINTIMMNNIDVSRDSIITNSELSYLFRSNGPVWYRGFFVPDTLPDVSMSELDDILDHFNADIIIVGHTTVDSVFSYFNNKIINVDGGIKYGESGQALLIEIDKYFRVFPRAKRENIF